MTTKVQVTFDCAEPARLAAFWAEALGYIVQPPPEGFDSWEQALERFGVPKDRWNSRSAVIDPDGVEPRIFFQQVPEGKTVKNRVHLDLRVAPGLEGDDRVRRLREEAERLVRLGAKVFREVDEPTFGEFCIVMLDPEGNEFCLD